MKLLLTNFWLKILAVLVAGLVWLHVATDRTYRTTRNIPVGRVIVREGLVAPPEFPDTLRVVVEATGKELILLGTETPALQINATSYDVGRRVIGLSAEQLRLLGTETDARVIRVVTPEFVEVDFSEMAHATLPVRAIFDPLTEDGFMVGSEVDISPRKIAVHAPSKYLSEMTEALTDSVPIRGLRNEVTLWLPLANPDPRVFRLEPDSVRVTLTILPTQRLQFDSIPIQIFNLSSEMLTRVSPTFVRIELIGPSTLTSKPDAGDIRATIDADRLDSLKQGVIELHAPNGWLIGNSSAKSAQVIMVKRDSE